MLPLLFAPALAAEITKVFLRMPRLQGWLLQPVAAPAWSSPLIQRSVERTAAFD